MNILKTLFLLIIISLFSCKNDNASKNRFKYYELISKKTETIDVKYVMWATTDRPNYILEKHFKNDTTQLIKYCFYLDTKKEKIKKFSSKNKQSLLDGKTIRLTGKFYKTKKFDDFYPYQFFEPYSFKPKNGYFLVFVYDEINSK
ncbi:hypothetical protein [Flavobacterium sp.]|uniref:hypothetical protein n=1 Tax=Flavobacterium sp. TaxID=239 RepID=UPI002EDA9D43